MTDGSMMAAHSPQGVVMVRAVVGKVRNESGVVQVANVRYQKKCQ